MIHPRSIWKDTHCLSLVTRLYVPVPVWIPACIRLPLTLGWVGWNRLCGTPSRVTVTTGGTGAWLPAFHARNYRVAFVIRRRRRFGRAVRVGRSGLARILRQL